MERCGRREEEGVGGGKEIERGKEVNVREVRGDGGMLREGGGDEEEAKEVGKRERLERVNVMKGIRKGEEGNNQK